MNVLARWGLRQTDLFLAVSCATRDAWAQAYGISPSKMRAIPNGVDVVRFSPASDCRAAKTEYGLPPDCRVVSFLGRLDRQKGVDVLIRAFGFYRRQHPEQNAYLLIAGSAVLDGEKYVDELRDLAAEIGIDCVRFIGRVTDPVKFFRASDLSILPSLWPEPYGLTLTESLACGVPVIASRTGGIPEILAADFPAHLVEPGDVDGLALKITQLVNWRMDLPQLGATCRNVAVSKFNLETCVDRIEKELLVLTQKVRL
jgi:glycosyltransferase involved in cell wall biosynthesis